MTRTQIKTYGEDESSTPTYAVTVEHEHIVYYDIMAVDAWTAERKARKLHWELTERKTDYAVAHVARAANP